VKGGVVMGKKKRQRSKRRKQRKRNRVTATLLPDSGLTWMDEGGVHALLPGEQPPPKFLELLTESFQKELRNSPMWDQMVEQFGEQEAEKLIKQCQAKFGE